MTRPMTEETTGRAKDEARTPASAQDEIPPTHPEPVGVRIGAATDNNGLLKRPAKKRPDAILVDRPPLRLDRAGQR